MGSNRQKSKQVSSEHHDTQHGESRRNTIARKSGKKQLVNNNELQSPNPKQASRQSLSSQEPWLKESIFLSLGELGHQPLFKDFTGEKQDRAQFLARKYKTILNYKELSKSSLKKT